MLCQIGLRMHENMEIQGETGASGSLCINFHNKYTRIS